MKLYHLLVNKHPGICRRYHRLHDNANGFVKLLSWFYLLCLNFAYYFLFFHFLDSETDMSVYEVKRLKIDEPESIKQMPPNELADILAKYDVISFDIFDTLIYRPFSSPTDLFYLIGIELEYMDFARIRCEAEDAARKKMMQKENHSEVTLDDIWKVMEIKTGIDAEYGKQIEVEYEKKFCYSNEYMLEVYRLLKQRDKKIIFTSDMYLPSDVILEILKKSGYESEVLFLSCELKKSKCKGDLYEYIKKTVGINCKYIHVGDNQTADVTKAKHSGFDVHQILNPDRYSNVFRANDMSPIIGGAYRGVVNNRLYNGLNQYSKYFEFGFIYGGIFVLGYCNFIHRYCKSNNINKVFFLARDGEIIKKVYNTLYPEEKTEYIYFSRLAACKLTAEYDKYDYLKKMVYHKVNKNYTFKTLLESMELEDLMNVSASENIGPDTKLTSDNIEVFIQFFNEQWNIILKVYQPQKDAAKIYFSQYIEKKDRIAVVDIGWAGTGAIAIRNLLCKEWNYDAEVFGIVAGTNTIHNAEPNMSEGFLLNDTVVSYMFSSTSNRDIWKKHNCNCGHNLFLELLVSSSNPSFLGFYPCNTEEKYIIRFLEKENNSESILEIQDGIIQFVNDYFVHFKEYPYMFNIGGRDAYAPILVAMSCNNVYLKKIYELFNLKLDVGK